MASRDLHVSKGLHCRVLDVESIGLTYNQWVALAHKAVWPMFAESTAGFCVIRLDSPAHGEDRCDIFITHYTDLRSH